MRSQAEEQYINLIHKIRAKGLPTVPSKGECLSIFSHQIVLPSHEVPLLLGREVYWKGIVGELKAFIANENTVEGFEKHGCNFWGAWSEEDGSLDVDYARLLHDFNGINQLKRVITQLMTTPDSRKIVMSLWDPSTKTRQIPCVLSYQFYVENRRLHMIWTQRSVDVMIGLASDMFSAWLFNMIVAKECGLEAGEVTMNLGDCHIYQEHLAGSKRYLLNDNESHYAPSPHFKLEGELYDFDFKIVNYKPVDRIKFELKV